MSASHGNALLPTPSSEAEVAELLRESSAAGRPVTVLPGGRTDAEAGDPGEDGPAQGALRISLERLDHIHEHEPADLTATVGAGLPLQRLQDTLAAAGQWLPGDAPGWQTRQVGGLVAGGRWGPLHLGYGTPRDHVLGATLVTGDGRILELGGKVVKNVAGFDLLRLVVGSRGSLGVVVRATVRLFPLPASDRTLLFAAGPVELHGLALRLAALPGQPAALEVLGADVPALAEVDDLPSGQGVVALRLSGSPGGVEALSRMAEERAPGPPARVLADEATRAFFDSLADVEATPSWVRFSVLPSHLPELGRRLAPALALLEGRVGTWWGTHVRAGILRLALPPDLQGESDGVRSLLGSVGGWARSVGGGFRQAGGDAFPGDGEPSSGFASSRIRQLEAGLRRVFDPADVMRPLPQWHP